jgi:hypothetical protein
MKKIIVILTVLACACCHELKAQVPGWEKANATAPVSPLAAWITSGKEAPLFKGLDGAGFAVTKNKKAQKYFNQGMMWSYGTAQAEAARSFYQATRFDSSSAMCWWGYALALGSPHGEGMGSDRYLLAYRAAQQAVANSAAAGTKEKALANALASRYSAIPPDDRTALDNAYADAMKAVYQQFPADADVVVAYVTAVLDAHAAELNDDHGHAADWTKDVTEILERALAKSPRHAGLNHLYLLVAEGSPNPGKAMTSADLLQTLVPGSPSLLHQSSHIDLAVGRYHDGMLANQRAAEALLRYEEACTAAGVAPLPQFSHTQEYLAACAVLDGNGAVALKAAEAVAAEAAEDIRVHGHSSKGLLNLAMPYTVAVRFGKWDAVAKMSEPEELFPRIMYLYASAFSAIAQRDPGRADELLAKMKELAGENTLAKRTLSNGLTFQTLAGVAVNIASGEMKAMQENYAEAVTDLVSAASPLAETKGFITSCFLSPRLNLAAVLIEAGRNDEAIGQLMDDLKMWPENGWALAGLTRATQNMGTGSKEEYFRARFTAAWKNADTPLTTSRILQPDMR